jgi:hypothetical protein
MPQRRGTVALAALAAIGLLALGALVALVLLGSGDDQPQSTPADAERGQAITSSTETVTESVENPTGSTPSPGPAPNGTGLSGPIELQRFGSIDYGSTVEDAERITGVDLVADSNDAAGCHFESPAGGGRGVRFLVSEGAVARVDVTSQDYATATGFRVGDTERAIVSGYNDQLEEAPHPTEPSRTIYTVIPRQDRNRNFRVVLETEANRVVAIRAGRVPEVLAVDGC